METLSSMEEEHFKAALRVGRGGSSVPTNSIQRLMHAPDLPKGLETVFVISGSGSTARACAEDEEARDGWTVECSSPLSCQTCCMQCDPAECTPLQTGCEQRHVLEVFGYLRRRLVNLALAGFVSTAGSS